MDGRVVSLRGRWRSLVAHLHDTQGVAGSSPARPTIVRDSRRPDVGPLPFFKGFRGFVASNEATSKLEELIRSAFHLMGMNKTRGLSGGGSRQTRTTDTSCCLDVATKNVAQRRHLGRPADRNPRPTGKSEICAVAH